MGRKRHCLKFKKASSGVVRCRVFAEGAGHPRWSSLLRCKKVRSQYHLRPSNKACAAGRGQRR